MVLLVHGVWMTGLEMGWLGRGLRRAGFRTRTFRYPSVRADLAENARRLRRVLDAETARAGADDRPLHLVGHSLGGLVIWRMFQDDPALAESFAGRVVTLGTPFGGSELASFVLTHGSLLGPLLVGASWSSPEESLSPAGAGASWTARAPLGVIAGEAPFGPGHFLGALPRPNDGIVALAETAVDGAADRLVLPVNHVTLTFDATAIRQTAHFLTHGRFAG